MRKTIVSILLLTLIVASVPAVCAGSNDETIDITNAVPSPIPGQLLARVIPRKWDRRCIPVPFRINDTLDPIPNPLGPAFLSVEDATAALQEVFDTWNKIRTSFIDLQIVGTTGNPGFAGFDFVNELTFRDVEGFGYARGQVVTLMEDRHLANGDDVDEDGDSDISSAIAAFGDADNDEDFELPSGFYKCRTILDGDVIFNSVTFEAARFTVDPADADTDELSVDLPGLATHEVGHIFGLGHTLINQSSATDGTGATMSTVDPIDPATELSLRSLHTDDIAFASFYYPEGSARSGPASLQPGDVAFDSVFGIITGELRHGVLDQPMAGGSLFAIDRSSGVVVASAISGRTRMSFDPATGSVSFIPSVPQAIVDGRYVLPVPRGNYSVGVEAFDGGPVLAIFGNFATRIGAFFGQQEFLEEFFNGNKEDVVEREPGEAKNVHVSPGRTQSGVDVTTNRVFTTAAPGRPDFVCCSDDPPGLLYAVAIPAGQLMDLFAHTQNRNRGHDVLIQAALFNTGILDVSVPVVFAEAMLTTGVTHLDNTATVDLAHPLERVAPFVAQDNDLAPFYFKNPQVLGKKVRQGIESGEIKDLFLVLRLPTSTPFPGAHGAAPDLGFRVLPAGVVFGQSYFSNPDGATFFRIRGFDVMFSLVIGEPAN